MHLPGPQSSAGRRASLLRFAIAENRVDFYGVEAHQRLFKVIVNYNDEPKNIGRFRAVGVLILSSLTPN